MTYRFAADSSQQTHFTMKKLFLRTSLFGISMTYALALMPFGVAHASDVEKWGLVELPDHSFELPMRESPWYMSQHAGVKAYRFEQDAEIKTHGAKSFKVTRHSQQVFGSVKQSVKDLPVGTYRLSADMKAVSSGTGKGWSLLATVRKRSGEFDVVEAPPLSGDVDWKRVTLEFQVTQDTGALSIGATLRGGGSAWIDNVRLERRRKE